VIAVNDAVARHLGREPTHVELVAAQRAARRLTEQYQVRIAHVSSGRVAPRGTAVLAREERRIADDQLVKAARRRLPEPPEQRYHPEPTSSSTTWPRHWQHRPLRRVRSPTTVSTTRIATRSATWWRDYLGTLLVLAASSERRRVGTSLFPAARPPRRSPLPNACSNLVGWVQPS
jgi:hypothetical protein